MRTIDRSRLTFLIGEAVTAGLILAAWFAAIYGGGK